MNSFDAASPFDARYYFADADFYKRLHPFVSEGAQVRYLARVEAALASTLADFGVCTRAAAAEIDASLQRRSRRKKSTKKRTAFSTISAHW